MRNELELSVALARKAQKSVDKFYKQLNNDNYQILLAPFYFKIGSQLATYVECNVDEMNNLKPLELPKLDGDEDDEEEEVNQDKENAPENKNEDDDEPQIEEVVKKDLPKV